MILSRWLIIRDSLPFFGRFLMTFTAALNFSSVDMFPPQRWTRTTESAIFLFSFLCSRSRRGVTFLCLFLSIRMRRKAVSSPRSKKKTLRDGPPRIRSALVRRWLATAAVAACCRGDSSSPSRIESSRTEPTLASNWEELSESRLPSFTADHLDHAMATTIMNAKRWLAILTMIDRSLPETLYRLMIGDRPRLPSDTGAHARVWTVRKHLFEISAAAAVLTRNIVNYIFLIK